MTFAQGRIITFLYTTQFHFYGRSSIRSVIMRLLFVCSTLLFSFSFCLAEDIDNVLLIGASVTASDSSPGDRIASVLGVNAANRRKEWAGEPSSTHQHFIDQELPKIAVEMIVALDLFFHDIFKGYGPETLERIKLYLSKFSQKSKYVIVGETITLPGFPGEQNVLDANAVINETAQALGNVIVIPFGQFYSHLFTPEGFQYRVGNISCQLRIDDVTTDSLHPNEFGEIVLTNFIIDALKNKFSELAHLNYLDIPKEFFEKKICENP